jgi:hypothetical protein
VASMSADQPSRREARRGDRRATPGIFGSERPRRRGFADFGLLARAKRIDERTDGLMGTLPGAAAAIVSGRTHLDSITDDKHWSPGCRVDT